MGIGRSFSSKRAGKLNSVARHVAIAATFSVVTVIAVVAGRETTLPCSRRIVGLIRSALNDGGSSSTALKEAVDAFDTIGRNYARQLLSKIPMTSARRTRWENANFAQLAGVSTDLVRDFDIDILSGLDAADANRAKLMFHRRHLFTHRGGIVDQKYLDESGDTSVQLGQLIRETNENVHHLLSLLVRIGRNLHRGYHSIIPIHEGPIRYHQEHLARLEKAKER